MTIKRSKSQLKRRGGWVEPKYELVPRNVCGDGKLPWRGWDWTQWESLEWDLQSERFQDVLVPLCIPKVLVLQRSCASVKGQFYCVTWKKEERNSKYLLNCRSCLSLLNLLKYYSMLWGRCLGKFWVQVGRRVAGLIGGLQEPLPFLCCWVCPGTCLWWGKWRDVVLRDRSGGVTWWLNVMYEQTIFLNGLEMNCFLLFSSMERCWGWSPIIIRDGLRIWGVSAAAGAKEGLAVSSELTKSLGFPISFLN